MKKKILFLSANPLQTNPLQLDEEVRKIDIALKKTIHGDNIELIQQWAVRISDIQEQFLRHQPTIVHFSGHGSDLGELIFLEDSGSAKSVSIDALEDLFRIFKSNLKCVVLNACYSYQQAHAISKHIDCVIGMKTSISDSAAIQFSAAFYQAVAFKKSVKEAFDLGCNQINLKGMNEEDIPILIANNNSSENIFLGLDYELNSEEIKLPTDFPKDLELHFDGHNLIIIPIESMLKNSGGMKIKIVYLLLKMRQSEKKYLIKVPDVAPIGKLAEYLVREVFPHLRYQLYDWTLNLKGEQLPSDFTLQACGIRNGDSVLLRGEPIVTNQWAPNMSFHSEDEKIANKLLDLFKNKKDKKTGDDQK